MTKNFLEKIKFIEDFGPFKKDTEIEFNDGMKDIIKFYLESKEGFDTKKAEKVAERMKINVIVGENGTGKSRLLNIINCKKGYEETKDDCENKNIDENILNNVQIYLKNKDIILDHPTIFENINITDNFYDLLFGTSFEENDSFWEEILESFFKIQLNILNYSIILDIDNNIDFYINYNNIDKDINKYEGYIINMLNIIEKIDIPNNSIQYSVRHEILNWLAYILLKIGTEYVDSIYKSIKTNSSIHIDSLKRFKNIINSIINSIIDIKNIRVNSYAKESKKLIKDLFENINFENNLDNINIDNSKKEVIGKILDKFRDSIRNLYPSTGGKYFKITFYRLGKKVYIGLYENNDKSSVIELTCNKEELGFFKLFTNFNNIIINDNLTYNNLSSGEQTIIARFAKIYTDLIKGIKNGQKNGQKNFLILIDEPDLHLHLDWQKQYIQKLIDVFGNLLKDITDINLHFIIATHSPFLLSDVPAKNVILLKKDGSYTKVIKWENLKGNNTTNTFGANFVDLIRNGFFFDEKNLMGSFAENVIGDIAQKRREEITIGKEIKNKKEIEKIEDQIGDSFLKDNLLYFKKKDAED